MQFTLETLLLLLLIPNPSTNRLHTKLCTYNALNNAVNTHLLQRSNSGKSAVVYAVNKESKQAIETKHHPHLLAGEWGARAQALCSEARHHSCRLHPPASRTTLPILATLQRPLAA